MKTDRKTELLHELRSYRILLKNVKDSDKDYMLAAIKAAEILYTYNRLKHGRYFDLKDKQWHKLL